MSTRRTVIKGLLGGATAASTWPLFAKAEEEQALEFTFEVPVVHMAVVERELAFDGTMTEIEGRKGFLVFLFAGLALLPYLAKAVLAESLGSVAMMALNALTVWCFVFGITGLFVRYLSNHSATMRFVSDASYWFYLVHLPLTAFGAGLLVGSGLPAGIKFVLILAGSTIICWVTYAYLVRGTFVAEKQVPE